VERPEAHRPSVPRNGLHANVSSPHVSSTTGSQAVSALHYAPSESATGQYPERLTGPQYSSLALRAARPPGPYLTRVARSAALDLQVAWVLFTRISESPPTPHFRLT
jgi:hypothetical protein